MSFRRPLLGVVVVAAAVAPLHNARPVAKADPIEPTVNATYDDALLEAVVAAFGGDQITVNDIDLPATRKRLGPQAYGWAKHDLNGDGLEEIIQPVGSVVLRDGHSHSIDGATGNHAWAILQPMTGGGWRVLHRNFSTGPRVLDSVTQGYRDLSIGWHMSASEGGVSLLRFDGREYRQAWSTSYYGSDGSVFMTPVPFDDEILRSIVSEQLSLTPDDIEVLAGGALQDDLDGDGEPELLVQIDLVAVDGQQRELSRGSNTPANWFFYVRQDGRWERVLAALNLGPICNPVRTAEGVILKTTSPRPERSDHYEFHHWRVERGVAVLLGAILRDSANLIIRDEAPSLPALIAKRQPLVVWNNRDMLWAVDGGFVLDRAFVLIEDDRPPRWVLVDAPQGMLRSDYMRATVTLTDEIPQHDSGPGNYAIIRSRSAAGDVLYEIGWESGPAGSGGGCIVRTIYLLRDAASRWRFVGEGPCRTTGRSGPESFANRLGVQVTWTGVAEAPLSIAFTDHRWKSEIWEETKPPRTTYLDSALDGPLPTHLRHVGPEYLFSEAGETLESVAARLTPWEREGQSNDPEQRRAFEKLFLERIKRRNAELPTGILPADTRINLPKVE